MNPIPSNQREKPDHRTPHDEVSRSLREKKERQKQFMKLLIDNIERYNVDYDDEIDMPAGYKDLATTKQQIKKIQKKLAEDAGAEWENISPRDPQYKKLRALLKYIGELERLPERLQESVREAHQGRFLRRYTEIIAASERKKGWENIDIYNKLNDIFNTLSDTEDFVGVWETPDGLSSQTQRESRELFIAIMAEKTNNFKNSFVLGKGFGENVEENIKNFPFLYNEFLEHEGAGHKNLVSLKSIAEAESAVAEANLNIQGRRSAENIIRPNITAGVLPSQLTPVSSTPATSDWKKRLHDLHGMVASLEAKASAEDTPAFKAGFEKSAIELKAHEEHARAHLDLSKLKDREKDVQSKFTRSYLGDPRRQNLMMELSMKKFVRAMNMVDKPYGNADWQYTLHPTIRRMLIASVYETGVATYETDEIGNVTYNDKIEGKHVWMMSALALSDYFSSDEVGEDMDKTHEIVLKAAYLGSKIAVLLEDMKPTEEVIAALIDVKKGGNAEQMSKFPPNLVERFNKYSEGDLDSLQGQISDQRKNLQNFLDEARHAIKYPYDKKLPKSDPHVRRTADFIAEMEAGDYSAELSNSIGHLGKIGQIDGASLAAYTNQMNNLQIHFKTASLMSKNSLMIFKGMGMHIEAIEPKYLGMIAKNHELRAEYWVELLKGTDDEFNQLIDLMEVILAGDTAGGQEDFIQGLNAVRKKYKGGISLSNIMNRASLEEGSEDAAVLDVLKLLQLHLSGKAEVSAGSDLKQKELQATLKGMHIGDKISKYVGGVWAMLIGPGQSFANRAAGLALMYGFYKSARMAIKGESKSGKILRALFVAGAIEIAAKEITGRGIFDRIGMDDISKAMEGTYEAVLVQNAAQDFESKEINEQAHLASLSALNGVPFHEVVAWYESSDKAGMPRNKKGKDKLPGGLSGHLGTISTKMGVKADSETVDKDMVARRVLYETVRHFFKYVGDKDNKRGLHHGKEALKERWITKVDTPSHKMEHSTYDHSEWFKKAGVKKSDINWQLVMRAEISKREVDLTKNQTPFGKLTATTEELYKDMSEWTRKYVANPASGHAEVFFKNMGEHKQAAQEFFADVCKDGSNYIYFEKERAILWYKAHKYEIKRTVGNHWKLLVAGVQLPFKIVYAVDDWAVPWTLRNLKAIEEILRSDKLDTTTDNLDIDDITTNPQLLDVANIKINPRFSFYGKYQREFLNAVAEQDNMLEWNMKPGGADYYYEDTALRTGYYVSEVSAAEVGITADNPLYSGEPNAVHDKILKASRIKAKERFFQTGELKYTQIEKRMDRIHKIVKTTDPQKVYIFWRMPLYGSLELDMKERGRYADYYDANRNKGRNHFAVKSEETAWENMQRNLALDMGPTRTFGAKAGSLAAQVPRFFLWNLESAGGILKGIGHVFIAGADSQAREDEFDKAVESVANRPDGQLQMLDELFTSASSTNRASSKFYKKTLNAKLFAFSHEFAIQEGTPLFLGIMQGQTGPDGEPYESTYNLNHSDPQDAYAKMLLYYRQNYRGVGDPDIDASGRRDMRKKSDIEIERAINDQII